MVDLEITGWTSERNGRKWSHFAPPVPRPDEACWNSSDGWAIFLRPGSTTLVDPTSSQVWGTGERASILSALAWADGIAGRVVAGAKEA